MFTPFAFFQDAVVVADAPASFRGYYIGGAFTTYLTATNPFFRMLDSTGSISSSFNIGVGFDNIINTVVTQSDDKIVVGGAFTIYSGSTQTRIARINTNGTNDTTLNTGTGFGSTVTSLAIQSDGKIIVGGDFTTYSGSSKNRITRLNISGSADTGSNFNIGVGFNSTVYNVLVQADQKIVAVGSFTTYSGSTKSYIARLNTNGTADTGSSFNIGAGFNNAAYASILQPDQKIVVGGNFTTYSGSTQTRIARLNTNGTVDNGSSWNSGAGFNSIPYAFAIQSDQKIIVGGNFTTYSGSTVNYITRLNTNGTIDTTFNTGTGLDSVVYSVAVQSDGKILAKGRFSAYSGSIANGIVRLNSNGTLDTTFNQNQSINSENPPSVILPLSNGSIILGGYFTGDRIGYATFLNSTGNTTTSSSIASYGLNNYVYSIVSQSDGKIILAGNFTFYSGSTKTRMIRIDSNGTPDTGSTFNIGVGFNAFVNKIALQSDQKIVAVGSFTTYSGSTKNGIVRLNTNGTADTGSNFNIIKKI